MHRRRVRPGANVRESTTEREGQQVPQTLNWNYSNLKNVIHAVTLYVLCSSVRIIHITGSFIPSLMSLIHVCIMYCQTWNQVHLPTPPACLYHCFILNMYQSFEWMSDARSGSPLDDSQHLTSITMLEYTLQCTYLLRVQSVQAQMLQSCTPQYYQTPTCTHKI